MHLLAYTPFIDPINAHKWWYLLLFPMAIFISIAYKAVRVESLRDFVKEAAVMAAQIVVAMILLGVGSYLFVQHVLPLIAPKA